MFTRAMIVIGFVMAARSAAAVDAAPASQPAQKAASSELWVGHQVVHGKRKIPVFGERPTRTDSYVLAEVRRNGDELELKQHLCRVEMASLMGVDVAMSDATVARLPSTTVRLNAVGDGRATAAPWFSGWGAEDVDGDGAPGVSVQVDAPMCDGTVYVTSRSTSQLGKNHIDDQGFYGEITVRVQQQTLGATSSCLLRGSRQSDESQQGAFLFRRVASGTTCASLKGRPWPVRATAPKPR